MSHRIELDRQVQAVAKPEFGPKDRPCVQITSGGVRLTLPLRTLLFTSP
jgi:hypothetical protein